MAPVFSSLNIGLQKAQAGGKRADRRFRAIARGVRDAFQQVGVQVMGLCEVGESRPGFCGGLSQDQSKQLLDAIQAAMPDVAFEVHANAIGYPYMLLSKQGINVNVTNVRVVDQFLRQGYRKAVRATLVDPGSDGAPSLSVDVWLVHLASSKHHDLNDTVRAEMLSHLTTGHPTVIAGDINTTELFLRQWIQRSGMGLHVQLARSPAANVLHGDIAISANVYMWQVPHRVGKSFDVINRVSDPVDRVSDAHDMVCFALAPLGLHDRSLASDLVTESGNAGQSSDDHSTADAAELGGPMDDLELEYSEVFRIRNTATLAVANAQQALCQVAGDTVNFDHDDDDDSDEQRELPDAADRWADLSLSSHSERPPSPLRGPILIGGALSLPQDCVLAMQEFLWPTTVEERARPADLLTFESDLEPTLRVSSFDTTVDVAALIMSLRQVALDRRVSDAKKSCFPEPHPDTPLNSEEVGWVMEFWRSKFDKQALSQDQVARDRARGYSNKDVRHRRRSRWYSYQHRALGNRKLGWAFITYGFNAEMTVLISAYQDALKDGDASSLPSVDLRKRTLSARAWFRWGKQIDNRVKSDPESWASFGPSAQNAWRWYSNGWSGEEADRLTKEYGHGMLRTGARRGTFIGQQAEGSVVDRMRAALQ